MDRVRLMEQSAAGEKQRAAEMERERGERGSNGCLEQLNSAEG